MSKNNKQKTIQTGHHTPHKTQVQDWKYLVFLSLIVFISFSPVLQNQFVNWDDEAYITQNEVIKKTPFSNLDEIFTHKINNFAVPLTLLSFQIEHYFFGLNPKPYHLNNLILHLFNVLLVYLFVKKLLATDKNPHLKENKQESMNYAPLLVALLFGIHPMNVESVAWATERKDLLYAFFALISLNFYLKTILGKSVSEGKGKVIRHYLFCLLFFVLSLLSKPQAIFFPFLIILIDYFHSPTTSIWQILKPKNHLNKILFFMISLLAGIYLLTNVGTKVSPKTIDYNLFEKILFSCYQLSLYLWKLFFPFYLNNFYPYPEKIGSWYPLIYYISPIALVGILAFIFWKFRTHKFIIFGVLFYLANIFIFLQIFSVNTAIAYERFNYIAYIGLLIIIVNYLWSAKNDYGKVAIVLFLLLFGFLSFQRCKIWTNNLTFFTDMAKKNPKDKNASKIAAKSLGDQLLAENRVPEAINQYNKAIQIADNYEQAYMGRAYAYMQLKMYQKSIEDYNKAFTLEVTPENVREGLFNRAVCFSAIKKYDYAINDYDQLLKIDPYHIPSYLNRAFAWITIQQYERAKEDYLNILQIDKNNQTAIQQLQYLQGLKK